jgi:hypothetical protein
MAIWSILRPFDKFSSNLVYFMVIWNIFSRFGVLYQENSGNPVAHLFGLPLPYLLERSEITVWSKNTIFRVYSEKFRKNPILPITGI